MYLFVKVYLPVFLYRAKHWHSSPCCAKCQQIKCVRLSVASWRKLRDERQIEGRVIQFSAFVSDDSRHEIGQFKGMVAPPSPVKLLVCGVWGVYYMYWVHICGYGYMDRGCRLGRISGRGSARSHAQTHLWLFARETGEFLPRLRPSFWFWLQITPWNGVACTQKINLLISSNSI